MKVVPRRLLGLGALALCLGLPLSAKAADWVPAASGSDSDGRLTVYVDRHSIRRGGGNAFAWLEIVKYDYSGGLIFHARRLISANCSSNQYRERETYYIERGQVIDKEVLGDRAPLKIAPPGSIIEGALDYACGR